MRNAFVITLGLILAACAAAPQQPAQRDPNFWRSQRAARTAPEKPNEQPASIDEPKMATEYFESPRNGSAASEMHQTPATGQSGPGYAFNFQEADVRGVISAILGDILKVPYTVAPTVQGKVTLRTAKPIAKDSVIPALEAALRSVSAVIVVQDGMFDVLPQDQASLRVGGATRAGDLNRITAGYAVEIVPLRYVSASEMRKVLDGFMPKGVVLQADNNLGHLIVSGNSQERAAVLRTVESFDVDWLAQMSFAVYHLRKTTPDQIIEELKKVFQAPIDMFTSRVRLVPIERMQAVLAMGRERADLKILDDWIQRLDATRAGDQRVFVYPVQNGSAKDLASSLRQVLSGEITSGPDTGSPAGSSSAAPSASGSATPVPLLSSTPTAGGTTNLSRLVSVDENNTLLFYGAEREYAVIHDALLKIDVLPRQVMIEAILAEVTLNDDLRYGVQWFFESGNSSVTLSAADTGSVSPQFPGFSYLYSGHAGARVVLNALQSKTDVKILSAPKLLVLNNQKASLQVGDQVPIITQSSQGTTAAGSPVINTIQLRDTGVILEVQPRVNDNGNVILDVTQEVSEVTQTTSSGIDSPTIQRRRLHSVISTQDGSTVALGGLIREGVARGNSGVPLLKDIPLLGNLFRTSTSNNKRTELLVLLVPRVMRNHEEAEANVQSVIDALHSAARLAERARPSAPRPSQ